ncbi:MAG: aldehyde dehydrogenase family protein [Lachnospiraceae bacterium]|jgi:succinate-semialdehyde dehydrogenase|nr:aldehyde dehydrogenase family protein [Lachnospiraceae bacterium]
MVLEYVKRARKAQEILAQKDQATIDTVVRAIAKYVYDNAEPLAKMAVEETRMGVYTDKVGKNQGKSRIIWNALKGKKSVGILREIPEQGLIEVAKPMGVIAAVTPCTNPVVTPMCNAMFAIKGANAIIVSPHPRARKLSMVLDEAFRKIISELGLPEDIYQTIPEPTIDLTVELMKACDVVIATGGMGVVRSAYSSGKPSFGVGAGNVQCIFDREIDYKTEVPKAVAGRIFDNGIICSGEQTIIAPKENYDEIIGIFEENGGYYIDDPQLVKSIGEKLFPNGVIAKDAVGQSVQKIAEIAGISVPEGTKVIIVKPDSFGAGNVWSKEKMFPVMSAYAYDTWEDAVDIAIANLKVEGIGHSVSIHSDNQVHIEYAGKTIPVSRILVNQICSTQNGGAFTNGLNPTTTLGCGSWGNNSISENLFYTHLFNVSRIATVKPNWSQPSDDEIWG